MTTLKIAFAALALVASMGAPAFAQSDDPNTAVEPEGERECSFEAEAGGYVCEAFEVGDSLSDLGPRNGPKKYLWIPIIHAFP